MDNFNDNVDFVPDDLPELFDLAEDLYGGF